MKLSNEVKTVLKKFSKCQAFKKGSKWYWKDGSGNAATNLKDSLVQRLADRNIISGNEEDGYKMTDVGFKLMVEEGI
jgi:hypothetical protein